MGIKMYKIEVLERTMFYYKRLQELCKLQCHCPKCNSQQIQVINYYKIPALWRCRDCKHFFEFDIPRAITNAESGRFEFSCPDLDQDFDYPYQKQEILDGLHS